MAPSCEAFPTTLLIAATLFSSVPPLTIPLPCFIFLHSVDYPQCILPCVEYFWLFFYYLSPFWDCEQHKAYILGSVLLDLQGIESAWHTTGSQDTVLNKLKDEIAEA